MLTLIRRALRLPKIAPEPTIYPAVGFVHPTIAGEADGEWEGGMVLNGELVTLDRCYASQDAARGALAAAYADAAARLPENMQYRKLSPIELHSSVEANFYTRALLDDSVLVDA